MRRQSILAAIREMSPGTNVVVVDSSAAAVNAAADADVIVGGTRYPGICEPEIIDNARELRWISSMSAGVARCVAIPSVKARGILLTNLRAIESASMRPR